MDTELQISLSNKGLPIITYGIDSDVINTITVSESLTIAYQGKLSAGPHKFWIEFNNKPDNDPDMAVIVDRISIEGISTDRMKWAGIYYPDYPQPWASEQNDSLPKSLPTATYLGWNGRWELEFTAPVFTWIHQIENLGWVYGIDSVTGELCKY